MPAALLKGDQLPTVVFTAQYFICVDAGEQGPGATAAAGHLLAKLRSV